MAEYFDRHYLKYDQWYENHPKEYADQVEFLRTVVPKGKGIEIGVGTGRFATALGIEYGIDIANAMVEESIRRGIKATLADAADLPFEDKFFDFSFNIVTMCFLEHPEESLIESKRVANLVITVILDRSCEYIQNILKNPRDFYKYAKFYTEDELIELYRKTGFNDIEVRRKDLITTDGQNYRLVAVIGR